MDSSKYMSLYELQSLIKQKIGASLPLPYWVVAEVSELKVNYSGHCYIELVEKGGENGVPCAKVNAVIWRNQYQMISSYFKSSTGGELKAGLKVLLKVVINYHELYGLSFNITDIEPSYTLGDLETQRKVTIERLQKDGVFDINRECDIPLVIQNIAVVSSRNAAGYQDFVNELTSNSKGYKYSLTLFDAFMQGNDAEESIIASLDSIAARMDDFDAVVFIRGGGSQSDLGAFNSYKLCSHLAQFPLPLITGIGHDKDKSVADLVSRVSLKTPTAVAGFISEHNSLFENTLDEIGADITDFAVSIIQQEKNRIERISAAIEHNVRMNLETQNGKLNLFMSNISTLPKIKLAIYKHRIEALELAIPQQCRMYIEMKHKSLLFFESVIDSKTPDKILNMGFSIIRSGGKVVRSIKDIGSEINIQLSDGVVDITNYELKMAKNGKKRDNIR